MAVFLHDEASSPAFTAKVKTAAGMRAALEHFVAKFEERHGAYREGELSLRDAEGNALDDGAFRALAPKADVFVVVVVRKKKKSLKAEVSRARELLGAKNYRLARAVLEAALVASPLDGDARLALAETLLAAGHFGPAASLFAALEPAEGAALGLARAEAGRGRHAACAAACERAGTTADVRVLYATALLNMDDVEEALAVTEEALRENESDAGLVRTYAACARKLGKLDEELGLLLRAVVIDANDKESRRALGHALDAPGAVPRLEKHVGESAAAAVAFLAAIAKDHGACWVAVDLLRWALRDAPTSASYALNLLHALEIVGCSEEALKVGLAALRARDSRLATACVAAAYDPPPRVVVVNFVEEEERLDDLLVTYTDDDLDLLAVAFAVTKLAYLRGDASTAAALVNAVEPSRRASRQPLHETTVRNEHAYYCCVAHILSVDGRRSRGSDDAIDVYFCGDSHALAPAWKRWKTRTPSGAAAAAEARIVPALVTGLKHWHLRPESEFYPKRNFYAITGVDDRSGPDAIPRNALVVFALGEIDCREGILVAVEKLRYRDVEEGIDATISHFVRAAAAVVRQRQFRKALVHPVPPVLDETRPIVRAYNSRLKHHVDNTPELTWLDFFDGFLTPDHRTLRADYKLDGTHLHPRYLDDLLIPALQPHLLGITTTTTTTTT
ncbi:hypothetical protein CTAYLR_001466 [Chrysophaeum taylorii]|uniref:Uncharacterized protein n=1 Tax=Chrysophaeum taylorii TaxID=2483200 RepID=A0AAD7XGE5_9STRA|nr:hypothetical protein CTAYLR_001466 [Chrysophaeum taylorii]